MRKLLFLAAGIALLSGAAAGFIYWVTQDPGSSGAAPVAEAPALSPPPDPGEPPPQPAVVLAPAEASGPPAPPTPTEVIPRAPRAEKGTWGAVPAVSRPRNLGQLAGPVTRGLAGLAPTLAGCYDRAAAAMEDSSEAPSLVLNLETAAGQVVVVDAVPATVGGANAEQFDCAVRALRGKSFPAPGAKPGQRHRLIHPLAP
jgi:hypothetical protein